ncbi:MAG TPA: hypothetical protein VFT19_03305 [Solirubrobacterales bacterium]|nr:hypothetical protein [Solirubrobacterales bacterium]
MAAENHPKDPLLLDEGSWAYLIGAPSNRGAACLLRDRVIETCEENGWPAVSRSFAAGMDPVDPGRFFEGVSHSVGHADFVVALLGIAGGAADGELAMAYGHRRPVVGIRLSGEGSPASETETMLDDYERARVVACDDLEECAAGLRKILSDPDFAATIHTAAGGRAGDA